jgi:hypothetical protein
MISCMISYMILRVQLFLVHMKRLMKSTRICRKNMISAHISKTQLFLVPLKCRFLNDIMTDISQFISYGYILKSYRHILKS